MARPKSMPDFSALLDASTPLSGKDQPRKKPSISLAAGLIMASESPKSMPNTPQHPQAKAGEWSDNLFYAYAQKVYMPVPLPFLCLFQKPMRTAMKLQLINFDRTTTRNHRPIS